MTDNIELTWLLNDQGEEQEQSDLLAAYYRDVASGPMKNYRWIIQGGNKQGQNYYVHVLDGINIFHKLRTANIIEMTDLEEQLLFTAYTPHDLNKIPPYGGRNVTLSYSDIATCENIKTELKRIEIGRFFPDWEQYLEEIRLLMLLHQHDAAPVSDLSQRNRKYTLPHGRLQELGKLMYAVDNLNLSHTLSENKHKQNFLMSVNAVAERRWHWVTHRLGENRAMFSNLIHNTVVEYLQNRHTNNGHSIIADLLYYPDGVAYLLPEREAFTWSESDTDNVARYLSRTIENKKAISLYQLIKASQLGIRVSKAAMDSGASYTDMMYTIRKRVDSKSYTQNWHSGYHQKLQTDIELAANTPDPTISTQARKLLGQTALIVPLEQDLLKRGELALAYYNLLNDHLKDELKKAHQCDPWTHVYTQLHLPTEKYTLYNHVNHYRRAYFISCDCQDSVDTLFERMLKDVADLVGEQIEKPVDDASLHDYLSEHLEFQGAGYARDFTAHLRYYCNVRHKQCCMCSSSSATTKLMGPEVPTNMGVQVFSNRLRGGSGEPKRNVCPICRTQLILEKLMHISFKKGSDQYTNFYLHLYPYAFFTRSYQDALYHTLKNIVHEDSQCFLFKKDNYYKAWSRQHEQALSVQAVKQAQKIDDRNGPQFEPSPTRVNGISVPQFSEATTNTPTLPLNAPGENYAQQFLFALTHALMIADFFGCRVALSRTPFPLLSNDYMAEHGLAFFVDGIPLNLRWLLPTNEYSSIETYRDGQAKDGGAAYVERQRYWQHERLDERGYAAYENIPQRLSVLYQLSRQLNLSPEDGEDFLLEAAMALADDPLSVYRVVDLTIEKQLKETHRKTDRGKTNRRGGSNKNGSAQHIAPEQMAIYLSKRVAPFLAELVKE